MLGIPKAPGGKGAEEFKEIRDVLEDWGIKKEIGIIVFDTTLANSGEWEGVCSYLSDWFGNIDILWCACRKHMLELRIGWFLKATVGDTKDPGSALFRRF